MMRPLRIHEEVREVLIVLGLLALILLLVLTAS